MPERGLYIALMSIHGLVRGTDIELGRDADTGGQIKYVVELARALAQHPGVDRVDLITRRIEDPRIAAAYAEPREDLGHGAGIVRITFGPKRYLRKESLWPHLDHLVDRSVLYFRTIGRIPDVVHGHYADGGWVCNRIAGSLGIPLVHTGHSLGRVKLQRLADGGMKRETIESRYRISQRIEAEEIVLDSANFVVASTRQEVDEQYALYDNYDPSRVLVIPPGVDLERFSPPRRGDPPPKILDQLARFLRRPRKPMILALSRADVRKNISGLIHAFGGHRELRRRANLVIVAGNRDDISELERGERDVLTEILLLIDRYDLHGCVAYPKTHSSDDVPELFRLAARSRGAFVNPALTEPFGLTILEAAASGVPVVATNDGGPREILARCRNGVLVDPLDHRAMGEAIFATLDDRDRWKKRSRAGLIGVARHYSWQAHVSAYVRALRKMARTTRYRLMKSFGNPLATVDCLLISDIDNTLIGDRAATRELVNRLKGLQGRMAFGVATGRHLQSTLEILKEWQIPFPDLLITSVGSEVHYGLTTQEDVSWRHHIDYRWRPEAIREALELVPGLSLQPDDAQRDFKISYFVDEEDPPEIRDIQHRLRSNGISAKLVLSHGLYLDVLPVRASKGLAVRYLATKWGVPLDRVITAGDSGNDEEMLLGETRGIVVANHSQELEKLRGRPHIFFAEKEFAWGVLEGIDHHLDHGGESES